MTTRNYLRFDKSNLILAITNLTALYPFYISVKKCSTIMTLSILISFLSSFFYHLYKNHKHNMGLKIHSKELSYKLYIADLFCAIWLVVVSIFNILPHKTGGVDLFYVLTWFLSIPVKLMMLSPELFLTTLFAFILLIVSELFAHHNRKIYTQLHSFWHLIIFLILGEWLNKA